MTDNRITDHRFQFGYVPIAWDYGKCIHPGCGQHRARHAHV
jgi:hypothetical protein